MLEPKTVDMDLDRIIQMTSTPAENPITVQEVKDFARIDGNDEDELIETFISSVRDACELWLGRILVERSVKILFSEWNREVVELPFPPLVSVTSFKTIDEDGVETVYSSDNYYVITEAIPGRIVLKTNASIPTTSIRSISGYCVEYQAGYGAASNVPPSIKEALKLWVTWVWENRNLTPEPPAEARAFLNLYRVSRL